MTALGGHPHRAGHLPGKAGVREKGDHPCGRGHGCHPAGMERRRQAAAPGRASHPHLPQLHRLFSGEKLRVEDMTIENDAGPGAKAGQAIAAYVDSARAAFERVRLLGNQDTLFCAPLPEKEREKDGFLGPRVLTPRRASAQYYHACEIAGDIDFIFAGQTPCLSTASCARWTTALRTAGSPRPPVRQMGWALCSGTAILSRTARRAACIWADRGGLPVKRRCWTAALGRTLRRRALPAGTTAPTRRWPALPRQAAPVPGTGERPGWVQALSAAEAAALLRAARQKCRMEITERITG